MKPYKKPLLSLAQAGIWELEAEAKLKLERSLPRGVSVHFQNHKRYQSANGSRYASAYFSSASTAWCPSLYQIRAFRDPMDDSLKIRGSYPKLAFEPEKVEKVSADDVTSFLMSLDLTEYRVEEEPCLVERDQKIREALWVHVEDKPRSYKLLFSKGEIIDRVDLGFYAAGQITFENSSPEAPEQTIEIPHLQDSGYLCTDHVVTKISDKNLVHAYSENFQYVAKPDSKSFAELKAFANATSMMDWFLAKDPKLHWSDRQVAIELSPHDPKGQGAFYSNPEWGEPLDQPTIFLPSTKESSSLINLQTDYDVVAHELSHHIIYPFISTLTPVSLFIHEGLSDYFVFANTNNSCLGETICHDDHEICALKNQCLRTAEHGLTAELPLFQELMTTPGGGEAAHSYHTLSMVLSGFLWEFGSHIGHDRVVDLLLKTLPRLPGNPNLHQFIEALFEVTQGEDQGGYQDAFEKALESKKLTAFLPQ